MAMPNAPNIPQLLNVPADHSVEAILEAYGLFKAYGLDTICLIIRICTGVPFNSPPSDALHRLFKEGIIPTLPANVTAQVTAVQQQQEQQQPPAPQQQLPLEPVVNVVPALSADPEDDAEPSTSRRLRSARVLRKSPYSRSPHSASVSTSSTSLYPVPRSPNFVPVPRPIAVCVPSGSDATLSSVVNSCEMHDLDADNVHRAYFDIEASEESRRLRRLENSSTVEEQGAYWDVEASEESRRLSQLDNSSTVEEQASTSDGVVGQLAMELEKLSSKKGFKGIVKRTKAVVKKVVKRAGKPCLGRRKESSEGSSDGMEDMHGVARAGSPWGLEPESPSDLPPMMTGLLPRPVDPVGSISEHDRFLAASGRMADAFFAEDHHALRPRVAVVRRPHMADFVVHPMFVCPCGTCGRSFKTARGLHQHIARSSGANHNTNIRVCDDIECRKVCNNKNDLKQHKMRHVHPGVVW